MSDSPESPASQSADVKRQLLQHLLATIAYRAGRAIHMAPQSFPTLRITGEVRTPLEIVAHMADLFQWAVALAHGQKGRKSEEPGDWVDEVERFRNGLEGFDRYIASGAPLFISAERLLQGPVADALTHVGQLAMLRRVTGSPIAPESYARAEIIAGKLELEPPPRK